MNNKSINNIYNVDNENIKNKIYSHIINYTNINDEDTSKNDISKIHEINKRFPNVLKNNKLLKIS